MYNKVVNTIWNVLEFYQMYAVDSVILNGTKDLKKIPRFH